MAAAVCFDSRDFDILAIPTFAERMEALRSRLTPRLKEIGERLLPQLQEETGCKLYVHVARHARRTVNPPNDTWVALSENPRGYKMLPHFAFGLFADRLFCRVGVLYETPLATRVAFAQILSGALTALPLDAVIVFDHDTPGGTRVSDLQQAPGRIEEAARRRNGEVMLERSLLRETVAGHDALQRIESLIPPLIGVYRSFSAQLPGNAGSL